MKGSELTSKVLALPDTDLQLERMMYRHKYNCPRCGVICPCTYTYVPGKDVKEADVVIHCGKCGDVALVCKRVGNTNRFKMKDTGRRYDPDFYTEKAYDRMMSAKKSDLKAYVDICNSYADQLDMEGDKEGVYIPYVKSMSAILDDLNKNGLGNLEYACHQILRCCDVCKLELFDVLMVVYKLVKANESLVPEPLYLRVMVEYYNLNSAYNGMFFHENYTYDCMCNVADKFEEMSPEDRAVFPFTAVEAYRFAMMDRLRFGTKKEGRDVAKKMAAAVEAAMGAGADLGWKYILLYYRAVTESATDRSNPYKAALDRIDRLGASNLCKGIMSGAYVDCVYADKLSNDDQLFTGGTPRQLKDLLDHVEVTIECLRNEPNLYHIGFYLAEAYAVRGIVNKDEKDADTALQYLDFFSAVRYITDDDLAVGCAMITANFDAPELKDKVLRIIGSKPLF